MISTNPTKCQLSNEDLTEYETVKSTWKKDPIIQSLPNKKNIQKEQLQQHRTNINVRIGVTTNKN